MARVHTDRTSNQVIAVVRMGANVDGQFRPSPLAVRPWPSAKSGTPPSRRERSRIEGELSLQTPVFGRKWDFQRGLFRYIIEGKREGREEWMDEEGLVKLQPVLKHNAARG